MGIYNYKDNKVCMIDSGSDSNAAGEALRHIREQGWELTAVFNTHSHADHSGGSAFLKEQTGCEIFAPKVDSAIIENSILNPTYLYGGYPMQDIRTKFLYMQSCECGVVTEDVLPEGLSYIHVDGHSFEMLAFHTPDDVWFTADTVMSAETLSKYKISFLFDIAEHLRSLERVRELDGKLFIPSHFAPVEDIRELCELNIRNTLEVAEDIKELCRDGLTVDELLEMLFERYSIRLYLTQYALVGCTTRSYLAWLHESGEIHPVFEGTRLLWRTT